MTSASLSRVVGALSVVTLAFSGGGCPSAVQAQSAPARAASIDGILSALDRAYVFPDRAAEMRRAIEAKRAAGAYARITDDDVLARTLTNDLQDVSHDKHLVVRYQPDDVAAGGPTPAATLLARVANFGIGTPEIRPGNIGYVELRSFGFPPDMIAEAVEKAMTRVADADALIIDLRQNGGGLPDAVAFVVSYLFGEAPVHLNSLYFRPADRTTDYYTLRSIPGKRFGPTKPVYVLTSARTFSAAEEFAYDLQSLGRATIVGETSGGGAHPGDVQRAGNYTVFVPSGRAINPITKTDWEGTGVRPEICVPADSALDVALAAARNRISRPQ